MSASNSATRDENVAIRKQLHVSGSGFTARA
jgi:hypothetical protein